MSSGRRSWPVRHHHLLHARIIPNKKHLLAAANGVHRPVTRLPVRDEGSDADDRVVDVLRELVADRLLQLHEELGLNGILAELNFGALIPHEPMTRSLQLLCENVMPRLQ